MAAASLARIRRVPAGFPPRSGRSARWGQYWRWARSRSPWRLRRRARPRALGRRRRARRPCARDLGGCARAIPARGGAPVACARPARAARYRPEERRARSSLTVPLLLRRDAPSATRRSSCSRADRLLYQTPCALPRVDVLVPDAQRVQHSTRSQVRRDGRRALPGHPPPAALVWRAPLLLGATAKWIERSAPPHNRADRGRRSVTDQRGRDRAIARAPALSSSPGALVESHGPLRRLRDLVDVAATARGTTVARSAPRARVGALPVADDRAAVDAALFGARTPARYRGRRNIRVVREAGRARASPERWLSHSRLCPRGRITSRGGRSPPISRPGRRDLGRKLTPAAPARRVRRPSEHRGARRGSRRKEGTERLSVCAGDVAWRGVDSGIAVRPPGPPLTAPEPGRRSCGPPCDGPRAELAQALVDTGIVPARPATSTRSCGISARSLLEE
jgi:hypothetical protein